MSSTLKLDWCSHAAAEYAVKHWHYSKTMPVSKSVKIGVWEDGAFIGCVLFAWGANPNVGKPYTLDMTEICELVRVALRTHTAPVSRIVGIALKMLKRQSPGLRLVVSYADMDQGHVGGIYQAGNWIYTGMTSTKFDFILGGQKLQRRSYTGVNFGQAKMPLPRGAQKVRSPQKHRYLYPLDPAMRAQISPLAQPYPKRAASILADAPAHHAGEEGAAPIAALPVEAR